jgi:hypothetical protein
MNDDLIPAPAIKPIGKPTFDPGEYEAYKRRAAVAAAKPKGPTLTPVDYDPFVGSAIRAATVTGAIGLGITGAACLAVFGFFERIGLGHCRIRAGLGSDLLT